MSGPSFPVQEIPVQEIQMFTPVCPAYTNATLSRFVIQLGVFVVAMGMMGAACDDRLRPEDACLSNADCGANEECDSQGACEAIAGEPAVSPEPTPVPDDDGGTPEPGVSPGVNPEPDAQPAVDAGQEEEDAGVPEPDATIPCQDLAEGNVEDWGAEHPFEIPAVTESLLPVAGASAVNIATTFSQPARLIYPKRKDRSVDASRYKSLVLSLRGFSSTSVFAPPVVSLEDCDGNTKRFVSTRGLQSGGEWKRFALPLDSDNAAWTTTGDVDMARLRAIILEVDAAGGYSITIDDVGFIPKDGQVCETECGATDCGGRGTCAVRQGLAGCACECMDLVEGNVDEWGSYFSPDHPAAVTTSMVVDSEEKRIGASAIVATTDASFDWAVVYPDANNALAPNLIWDLSQTQSISFWARGENENVPDWQGAFPSVVLRDDVGGVLTLTPSQNLLTDTWAHHLVPLVGGNGWTSDGAVTLSIIRTIEFHADTWENSFLFWIDGVAFRQIENTCLQTCLTPCTTGTCQDLHGMPTCY